MTSRTNLTLAMLLLLAGCADVEDALHERFRDATPREVYGYALATAGLDATALGRDWAAAGARALDAPTAVQSPFQETGYLSADEPDALGYRIEAHRGEHYVMEVSLAPDTAALLFLDLFRHVADDTVAPLRHTVSADSGARRLEFEPRRDGTFILRVQPELLRGGRYTVRIIADAALAFPVDGGAVRDVGSVFGDPRDGGSRDHHGIDIFARRNTPVLAAAEGTVSSVRTTPIGGRVVWLRDHARGQSLYYAHLERQLVERGQRVHVGDTLGLVGNSGNARTTPTHLHFGIYRRGEGPVDPLPFVRRLPTTPPALEADTALVGAWGRVAATGARLRGEASVDGPVIGELDRNTPLRVLAATGSWYRVRLPDGTAGFLAARLAEAATASLRRQTFAAAQPVRDAPHAEAPAMELVGAGEGVEVLGEFGEFLYVRAPDGRAGWMALDD